MENESVWKDKGIAYTMLTALFVAIVFSAVSTVTMYIMLFPVWLLVDRRIYEAFDYGSWDE